MCVIKNWYISLKLPHLTFHGERERMMINLGLGNLRVASCSCELRVASCELRVASCELRVASCELRVASCELRVASCELRVASCELPKLENKNL